MERKYFKPASVTWWSGVGLVLLGAIIGIDDGYDIGAIADVVRSVTGGQGAATLIGQGAGLIGLRGAIK